MEASNSYSSTAGRDFDTGGDQQGPDVRNVQTIAIVPMDIESLETHLPSKSDMTDTNTHQPHRIDGPHASTHTIANLHEPS